MTELKIYTMQEVATLLKIARRTVSAMLKDGRLQGTQINSRWRISSKNIEDFMSNTSDKAQNEKDKG